PSSLTLIRLSGVYGSPVGPAYSGAMMAPKQSFSVGGLGPPTGPKMALRKAISAGDEAWKFSDPSAFCMMCSTARMVLIGVLALGMYAALFVEAVYNVFAQLSTGPVIIAGGIGSGV